MAEEFQTGICGGNWWNLSKNMLMGCSSPCSASIGGGDLLGGSNYGTSWLLDDHLKLSSSPCKDSDDNIFQDSQKHQQTDSDHSGGSNNTMVMDNSTMQMMGFGSISSSSSSSSSSDWSCQTLLHGRGETNYIQEGHMNNTSQIQNEWSPKSFTSTPNQDFALDHHQQQQQQSYSMGSSSAAAYGYHLFEPEPELQQQSNFNGRTNMSYSSNYGTILNELSPSWPKIAPFLKPSLTKQQSGGMQFSNINTPFWNSSSPTVVNDIRPSFLHSNNSQPQFLMPNFDDAKLGDQQVRDSGLVMKKGSEPVTKRARIETPSPLPTFKVRKEKLGDRITALQQLVSPFGKTDTASVLHEAIEYIKFLHDQVLSTPYMKNGIQHQNNKETEAVKQDLKSRGLCLVPISSTYPVANETTADFWTPTFGGTFR
ncbi:transcription factor bHLH112-like isoform X2 [Mercurialis annua]|uniref:transcription factor bHLH112-like isoform X2 n=1 Tax=Mercurialis annua TaxID=3986 RepID=UPI00215F0B1E|nr:transcription factor bHLH112-like isoform X2 [Mercurialis annua]